MVCWWLTLSGSHYFKTKMATFTSSEESQLVPECECETLNHGSKSALPYFSPQKSKADDVNSDAVVVMCTTNDCSLGVHAVGAYDWSMTHYYDCLLVSNQDTEDKQKKLLVLFIFFLMSLQFFF